MASSKIPCPQERMTKLFDGLTTNQFVSYTLDDSTENYNKLFLSVGTATSTVTTLASGMIPVSFYNLKTNGSYIRIYNNDTTYMDIYKKDNTHMYIRSYGTYCGVYGIV